jgi:hypothetical protein
MRLNPQMSTPVAVGDRVFCVNGQLDCFVAARGLDSVWRAKGRSFCEFGALVASEDRILVQGRGGEFLLFDVAGDAPRVVSRMHVAASPDDQAAELFTFPAIVGSRLYVRCEREVVCVDLGA